MTDDTLKMAFVGDVCLGFFKREKTRAPEFPGWTALQEQIGECDALVGNLECCLVDAHCSGCARGKSMAVPVAVATPFLRAIGFSDLCLANNHSMDCGAEAIPVMQACLTGLGMTGFGAGRDIHEAELATIVERGGRRIAYVSACDKSEFYASADRAGIAPLEKSRLGRRVRAAATQADLVIVILHADLEFSDVPGRWRQRLSRRLIEQGAHLVIQHHPHVLQGIETYKGGLIAYSLGNFVFKVKGNRYQEHRDGASDGMVLVVDVEFRGTSPTLTHRVVPVRIGEDHLPYPVSGFELEDALQKIQTLCDLARDVRARRQAWFRRCCGEARMRVMLVYYACRHGHFARGAHYFWNLLSCREDRRWIAGLISLGYL